MPDRSEPFCVGQDIWLPLSGVSVIPVSAEDGDPRPT